MLVEVTNEALELAIGVCAPGRPFKDIGNLIHKYLYREADGDFCVSTQFTGHGIGTVFHRPPWIMHHCEFSRVPQQASELSLISE